MDTGIIFWICTISIVCVIASIIYYKPYLGIVFIIISIPFEGNIILDSISIYPLEVILAMIVFICMIKFIVKGENYFKNTKLVFFYLPFILCILLSALKYMEFSLMVKEAIRWLELILIYFLTINLVTDYKKTKVILYSVVLTTAIVSLCGIINYLSIDRVARAFSFFGNPNPFAGYVGLVIPVLFGMMMTSTFYWERIVLGTAAVFSILTWFLAFSRSAVLSLVLTMILVLFLAKVNKKIIILVSIVFTIFAVTFLSSNLKIKDRVGLSLIRDNMELRAMCYPIGYDLVKDDMMLGIGIGNYHLRIKEYVDNALHKRRLLRERVFATIKDSYIRQFLCYNGEDSLLSKEEDLLLISLETKNLAVQQHLHSLYLQLFVEMGLIGLCSFVFWLALIVKYLMSALKSLENSGKYYLFVGVMAGVIVYLFNNLTDILTVHGIHLQWGIILGLAVVLIQFRESEKCPEMI